MYWTLLEEVEMINDDGVVEEPNSKLMMLLMTNSGDEHIVSKCDEDDSFDFIKFISSEP
jgi:hypothetical protein